jgi:calmodulin
MLLSNKLHTEDIREEMKSAFRVFDRDNDGVLTASELRDVLSTLGHKISDDEVDDFVRAADRSGDGRIDYEGNIALYFDCDGSLA